MAYSRLTFQFQVHTKPVIYATNSRSLLTHMNQMKYAIEYHVALAEGFKDINYDDIEDLLSDMLLSSPGPGKYEKPKDILQGLTEKL